MPTTTDKHVGKYESREFGIQPLSNANCTHAEALRFDRVLVVPMGGGAPVSCVVGTDVSPGVTQSGSP